MLLLLSCFTSSATEVRRFTVEGMRFNFGFAFFFEAALSMEASAFRPTGAMFSVLVVVKEKAVMPDPCHRGLDTCSAVSQKTLFIESIFRRIFVHTFKPKASDPFIPWGECRPSEQI